MAFNGVALSPDGRTLALVGSDGAVQLWDVATREPFAEPLQGLGTANGVAFSPDGKTLAIASGDVRLWDTTSLELRGEPLRGHDGAVSSVAFSPDGETLASVGRDGTVWLWDLRPTSWITLACGRANRNLSLSEWRRYAGKDAPYEKVCPELPPGEGIPAK